MSGSLTTSSLANSQNGYKDILDNITNLQDLEKQLYKELETNASVQGNDNKQLELINRINEVSNIRISLLKTLNQTSSTVQNSIAASRVDLVDQMTLIGMVESQLNQAKAQMNQSDNIKNEKLRMVEINTYYGKRYQAHTELIKLLIYISTLMLILTILIKKELIPDNIGKGAMGIVMAIGIFFLVRKLIDIYYRDNMDFDQYEWLDIPTKDQQTVFEFNEEQLGMLGSGLKTEYSNIEQYDTDFLGCIGKDCCSSQMTYDEEKRKCVDKVENLNKNESFLSGSFGANDSVNLNPESSVVKPFGPYVNFASI
jgi:hypothetical protein